LIRSIKKQHFDQAAPNQPLKPIDYYALNILRAKASFMLRRSGSSQPTEQDMGYRISSPSVSCWIGLTM
jgi:hypothetical protein